MKVNMAMTPRKIHEMHPGDKSMQEWKFEEQVG